MLVCMAPATATASCRHLRCPRWADGVLVVQGSDSQVDDARDWSIQQGRTRVLKSCRWNSEFATRAEPASRTEHSPLWRLLAAGSRRPPPGLAARAAQERRAEGPTASNMRAYQPPMRLCCMRSLNVSVPVTARTTPNTARSARSGEEPPRKGRSPSASAH